MQVKAKVLRTFKNKYSKKKHKKGEVLTISESRFDEINDAGHGKLVELIEVVEDEESG